jgi:hypothetical protein
VAELSRKKREKDKRREKEKKKKKRHDMTGNRLWSDRKI